MRCTNSRTDKKHENIVDKKGKFMNKRECAVHHVLSFCYCVLLFYSLLLSYRPMFRVMLVDANAREYVWMVCNLYEWIKEVIANVDYSADAQTHSCLVLNPSSCWPPDIAIEANKIICDPVNERPCRLPSGKLSFGMASLCIYCAHVAFQFSINTSGSNVVLPTTTTITNATHTRRTNF